MPGKAMLFNTRCESVYDFGTGHRNTASFNPHGSDILSFCCSCLLFVVVVVFCCCAIQYSPMRATGCAVNVCLFLQIRLLCFDGFSLTVSHYCVWLALAISVETWLVGGAGG